MSTDEARWERHLAAKAALGKPAWPDLCSERWGDEVGCDDGPWHHCVKESAVSRYRKHECSCGAFVLETVMPDVS